MNWSSKWFYFLVISFLLYTVAGGYGSKWKTIFTTTINSSGGTTGGGSGVSSISPVAPISPIAPITV